MLTLALFITGCAVPQIPTGGDKDETPPKIIDEKSTPNFQTNFTGTEILLSFDEWVVLEKVNTQLITSPLMPQEPEVKLKGKSVVIKLPENLKENTTYTLQFGDAIRDLNESNKLDNYAFVFSTGPNLDSASLAGRVVDAVKLTPAENIWVALYPVQEDSAVFKRKPDYVAKTNKDGQWRMANLRSDSFAVFAIKDENLNYIADQESEWLGWLSKPVVTNQDAKIIDDLYVSPRARTAAVSEVVHREPGLMRIPILMTGSRPEPVFIPPVENSHPYWSGDTLLIYYPTTSPYSGQIILGDDTTSIRVPQTAVTRNQKFIIRPLIQNLYPKGDLNLQAGLPITAIDTSKFILTNDLNERLSAEVILDQPLSQQISIKAPWKEGGKYFLQLEEGAAKDYWGRNSDTLRIPFSVQELTKFGDLILIPTGLDSTKQYIMWLKNGDQVIEKYIIKDVSTTQIRKNGLVQGKFTVDMVEDLNRNEFWDTGDYFQNRQPEKRLIFTPEGFRAGWEVEVTLNWQ